MATKKTTKKTAPKKTARPLLEAALVQNPHKAPVSPDGRWNKAAAQKLAAEYAAQVNGDMTFREALVILGQYGPLGSWKGCIKAAFKAVLNEDAAE